MTSHSKPKFSIDFPISFFVGIANVWECADLAFPFVFSWR